MTSKSGADDRAVRTARARLTRWYVGVSAVILALFGGAVYLAVSRQVRAVVDRQLVAATAEAERALRVRERERTLGVPLVDALDELVIPGIQIHVLTADGGPLAGTPLPAFLKESADTLRTRSEVWQKLETGDERSWRVYGRAVEVGGAPYRVLAVADAVELEQQYPALLLTFLLAAAGALGLVGMGGRFLADRALEPVRNSMARTRRFVADASHELRTPTAVMLARSEVALDRPREAEEYVAALQDIASEAQRLGRLIDDLLFLAAADEQKLRANKAPLFLDDLVVQAARLVGTLARQKDIRLRLAEFDEVQVFADRDLVLRLLVILLDNAVKYTPSGGRVSASVTAHGDRAVVEVEDDGPGIPPDVLPHVFERFVRADAARTGAAGSGLGLAIARSIAEAHGAQLTVTQGDGRGTRVRVSFRRLLAGAAMVLATSVFLEAGSLSAQQSSAAPQSLSLAEVLERAQAKAPTLALAQARVEAARAAFRQAKAFDNPALALGYSRSVPNYHMELEQPLDALVKRGPRLDAASAELSGAEWTLAAARADLRYQVELAYAQALGARARAELSRQAAIDGEELVRIAEAREAAGDASALDVQVARVAFAEQRSAALADSLSAISAVTALQSLLGLPVNEARLQLADPLAQVPDRPSVGEETPSRLQAATARTTAQVALLSAARRDRIPVPALRFGFETGDPSGAESGVLPTVGVAIPLPWFDRSTARVREAEANLVAARADQDETARQVALFRGEAERAWTVAESRLSVDVPAAREAEQVAALIQQAYREGAYPLASTLEARRSALAALQREVDAYVAARAARAGLEWAFSAGGGTP
ncbi:MAG: TolC family protein [Gemmatimonadota bacterium]